VTLNDRVPIYRVFIGSKTATPCLNVLRVHIGPDIFISKFLQCLLPASRAIKGPFGLIIRSILCNGDDDAFMNFVNHSSRSDAVPLATDVVILEPNHPTFDSHCIANFIKRVVAYGGSDARFNEWEV
jgi:hypothetical protein